MMKQTQMAKTFATLLSIGLVLTGCSATAPSAAVPTEMPVMNQAIHDALPKKIKDAGELTVVISYANPPWFITDPGKTGEYTGAGAQLMDRVGDVMGVDVNIVAIPDIAGAFAAISSERYAFGFPYADLTGGPQERAGAEFVGVLQEVLPFLVLEGNPKKISSLDELCGVTVAASANAATYKAAEAQKLKCEAKGETLDVLGTTSIPNGVLAVRSGRADAFFTGGAAIFYAAQESEGELEVVGDEFDNGFEGAFMGALLPEGSDLTQPLLGAFQILFDNGEYETIMKNWGMDREMIEKPGINLHTGWIQNNPSSN